MSRANIFDCPACGSPLSAKGGVAEIQCKYCGKTIIVLREAECVFPG